MKISNAFAISFSDVATAALISALGASSLTSFVANVVAAWFTAFASETAFSAVFSAVFKLLIAASNAATCASTYSCVAVDCATKSLALFNSTAALTVLTCLSSDNSFPDNATNRLSN